MRGVKCFLGFAIFYRKFIKDYSKVVLSLTQLTHKDQPFIWSLDATEAFESLKRAFKTAPILAHVDPTKRFILEADAHSRRLEMMDSYTLSPFIHESLKLINY